MYVCLSVCMYVCMYVYVCKYYVAMYVYQSSKLVAEVGWLFTRNNMLLQIVPIENVQ